MRKFLTYLIMILLASGVQANAHAGHISIGGISFSTIDDPAPDPYGDFSTLVVPIKRAGNLIIIEAKVDSITGNFVLDTGAPHLVLNATYFRDMPRIANQESGGVNGEVANSFITEVQNFAILDLFYKRLKADVTDLSAIENGRNIKILGLLGTRLFAKLAITVDIFNNVLYIHKLNSDGDISPAELPFSKPFMKTGFKLMNDVIFLKTSINNNTLWMAFDTGAETNLLDYRRSKKIIRNFEVLSTSKLTGVGGSVFEIIYAKLDKLMVGENLFTKNQVVLTSLDNMGKAYGHSVDGILGYDFFMRGVFTINFVKKEFAMYTYKV
ncbi:aspartyl protease family protein [Mucilaginibacter sp. UR6-1]|uniref:pepsin/retropepsin-like aspartic protease family protein n=1 Tax=Mucilaginibacter sp. UR6-1 TaxID=1435643 RepID=UPI001E375DC2|nr:pepsin/retropepsin-like aspartic protease family protein [Mucilaginibacter sp. UR6-1]MCC8407475.1 aspartyl protease family protein [Mucilaginibacter sp. UR6-1]